MIEAWPKQGPRCDWYSFRLGHVVLLFGLALCVCWGCGKAERNANEPTVDDGVRAEITRLGGKASGNPEIFRVDFSETQIGNTDLESLQNLTNLSELDLSGTQITDSGLEHLQGLTNLFLLDLSHTQITDAGLVHLKGLTGVRHLRLKDTRISGVGVEHLAGLTKLEVLDRMGVRMGVTS